MSNETTPQRRTARHVVSSVAMDVRPFKIRDFRRLFYGNALTMIGAQMTIVAVGVQVYGLTKSSAMVGYTSLFALVPLIVFGLIGGALADSIDRRKLVVVSTVLTAATSVLLYLQSMSGLGSVLVIWLLVAVQSATAAIYRPARAAMLPKIVPAHLISAANTISSSTMSLGMILGPLIAGVIIAQAGLDWTYLVEAVLLVGALFSLLGLPSMPVERTTERRNPFRDVWDGFVYLRTQPLLMMQFVVDLIAMIFGWPLAVFPALADGRFGEGAIGWLYAGTSIGAVLAGLLSGWISHLKRHGAAIIVSVVIWGAAIIVFAFVDNLVLGLACLAFAGAADLVSASLRMTMLQVLVPDELRGRMQGTFMVVVAGGPRLGDVRLGVTAAALGPTVALWSGGVVIVVAMVLCALLMRSFWAYRHAAAPSDS